MNRFIDLIGLFSESAAAPEEQEQYSLPDYGPINIPDYEKFLEKSKDKFYEKWNSLVDKKEVKNKIALKDFNKKKLIGTGSFGKVYLVKNEQTGDIHAMKAILKKTVVRLGQVVNTRNEKLFLQCTNCPYTLRMDFFFKDNSYLYFILPFIQGGELYQHLLIKGKFDELLAMFYLAQVILALEYLHYLDFVYRDLKPENILLDHTGYIKLADFGFCKRLRHGRTYTFCGTMDYLAPEIILNEGYGKAADWWAVGVLAFELTTGSAPFSDDSDQKRIKKIVKEKYNFPSFISADLKNLITNTLKKDLSRRYGNLKDGVNDLKNHKWFKPLNWQAVVDRKAKPSYIPTIQGPMDLGNFRVFKYESLVISDFTEYEKEFADF